MDKKIEDKVRQIVMDQLGVDACEVTLDSTLLNDLGADSLDITEICMSLEEDFKIREIDIDDADKMLTIKDVVTFVEANQNTFVEANQNTFVE